MKTIIIVILLLLLPIALAEDSELFIPSTGDEELYIGGTGDEELGVFFQSQEAVAPTIPSGGGLSQTTACWKVVNNDCIKEDIRGHSCPSGYYSTQQLCESSLGIAPMSFFDSVSSTIKDVLGLDNKETETEIDSTEEGMHIVGIVIMILIIIGISWFVLKKTRY